MAVGRLFPFFAVILSFFAGGDRLWAQEEPPPQLRYLAGSESPPLAVGYGANGQTIVGACENGKLYFWDSVSGKLISQMAAHAGPVLSLAVSPDGHRLATGGRDRLVKVFDLPSIHPLANITGFAGPPTAVAVSADGKLVLTGDPTKQVRLWNVADNANPLNFTAAAAVTDVEFLLEQKTAVASAADGSLHGWSLDGGAAVGHVLSAPALAIAASPDEASVAVAGRDGVVRLVAWPPQAVRGLANHSNPVTAVASSRDGKLLFSGGAGQTVRSFDAETGKLVHTFTGQSGPVTSIDLDAEATLVASGSKTGVIKFWQTEDAAEQGSLMGHEAAVYGLAFHPAKRQIASAGEDGTIRIWQLPESLPSLAGHTMPVNSLALGVEGKVCLTAAADRSLRLWNLEDAKQIWAVEGLPQPPRQVATSPGGEQFASTDAAGTLRLHALADGEQLHIRGGHTGAISGLAFPAGNNSLVTSGLDGAVKIWRLPLVAPRSLPGHPAGAARVVFASENTLVTAAAEGKIAVLEAATGKPLRQLEGLEDAATALAVSVDGKLIAAGTKSGEAKFWTVEAGKNAGAVAGHSGAVNAVAFHPEQPQIATAGDDGTVRIWQYPQPAVDVVAHTAAVRVVAASKDGKQIVTGGDDGVVHLWAHAAKMPAHKLAGHQAAVLCAAFRPDAKQFATGDKAGRVRLWNPADRQVQAVLGAHEGAVTAASYHVQNAVIATGGEDGSIKIWNVPATPSAEFGKHAAAVGGLAMTANSAMAISGGADKTLKFFDIKTVKQIRSVNLPGPATSVAISPNNALVAAAVDKKSVQLFQVSDAAPRGTAEHPGVTDIAFAPNNTHFATVGTDATIRVWQLPINDDSVPMHEIVVGDGKKPLTCAEYTPGGAYIAVGDGDRNVTLFSVAQGNAVRSFAGNTAAVQALTISADGSKVASAGGDKTVRVWNQANGKLETTLQHPAPVRCVSLRADAMRAITGCDDGVLRVWDLASGKLVQRIFDHTKPITAVAVAGDNTTIISAGDDGTVRRSTILDKVFLAEAHAGGVRGLAFTPNGQQLVSCGADKLVKVFDLTGKLVRQMANCPMPLRCLALRGDSLQVTAAGEDNQLYQWRLDNGQLERKVVSPAAVASLAYNADNTRLAAAGADGHLRTYNPTDGQLLEDVTVADEIHSVTFAVDNTKVIIGRGDKRVSLQQLPFMRLLSGHDGAISSLAYLPDGSGLISGGADKSARHWNLETGKVVRSLVHTDAVTGVGVTADGVKIISTSADKTVRVWTLASGAAAATITLESPVRQFSLSADSTRAVTAGDDHIIRVWDIATARELERFTGHEATVSSLALSADNRTVISAAADKTVRAWTVGVDRLFVADLKSVHTMVLTPEGKQIVTAGEDKLVKLWDFEGKMVRQFSGAAAPPRSVAVRGDGLQIAAGGDPVLTQVNVYVWNAANGQPVRTQKMPAPVSSLTYSGDGKLAVATADKHLRAYASDDARLLQDWTVAATLNDLTFTPDHTTVVAAAADNQAYILDYALRRLLTGHVGPVTGVAFTPTGGRLLSCGADKSVRLWNAADGKLLSQFVGSTAAVHSLALSRDGTKVTAAGEDKIVRVWDVPADQADPPQQVQPSATFTHPAIVRSTSITDNGSTVAAGGDDNLIRLWDVATGKERERIAGPAGAVLAVSLSADGRDLVSGSADNHARQMFPSVSAMVAAQQGEIHDVVFAADGDAVFTAGADKFVQRSSLRLQADGQNEAKTSLQFTGATAAVRAVAVSRDGKYVSAGGDDMHVRVWNASDGKSLATIKTPAMVTSVVTSGDGRTIVAAGADKIIRNYALLQIDGAWQLTLTHESHGHTDAVTRMSLAGDDRTLLSVAADSTAKRWLVASALPRRQLSGHKGPIYDLAFHKDGRLLASASGDRTARVWDLADGEVRFTCKGHERQVTGVSFHPNGNQLASCSLDASVRLWSSEIAPDPLPADAEPDEPADPPPPAEEKNQPGDPLNVLVGDIKGGLNSLAYAPNGNYLVAAGLAKVWGQWPTGGETPFELLRSGQLHNYQIYRIVPNPASTRFATIDFSGKLFIWDAANGNPLFHQQLPASSGYSIAYAPNGQELAAATSDLRVVRVLIPIPAR